MNMDTGAHGGHVVVFMQVQMHEFFRFHTCIFWGYVGHLTSDILIYFHLQLMCTCVKWWCHMQPADSVDPSSFLNHCYLCSYLHQNTWNHTALQFCLHYWFVHKNTYVFSLFGSVCIRKWNRYTVDTLVFPWTFISPCTWHFRVLIKTCNIRRQ
jgi:hypothetical protein